SLPRPCGAACPTAAPLDFAARPPLAADAPPATVPPSPGGRMVETWVVVADGSRCRIFASDASLAELEPVEELRNGHHVGGHRGRPNEGHDSANHGIESKFAADVAAVLTRAVQANAVRDLLLVAPSRFLGDLLASLPKSTS